jgi:glycosyltransferase involved in cell wall biosynthesis/peptidoglycan/xylan/chitin deacetylase (PgdA/CDA1 family)
MNSLAAQDTGMESKTPQACSEISGPMPLRIGFLMDHPSPHTSALLEAVAARSDCTLEVVYCGRNSPGRNWESAAARVPHRFVDGITGPRSIRFNLGIIRTMNRLRVDAWVLNTICNSPTTLMAAWWLRFSGKPWAFMNEPVRPRCKPYAWLKDLPLKFVLHRADGIIGTGKMAVEMYRQRLRKDCLCESVPYFIDLSAFSNLPGPAAPVQGRALQFVTLCRMAKGKGLDSLLQACERLPERGWQLTLFGDGPLRSKLEKEFAPFIRCGKVKFPGNIPYPDRAMAFANRHVFVFPSRWDGWGMVLPEALAAGLPAVVTDRVVSAHEFIKDGENGFIVPAGDSRALAEKMLWFIHNASACSRMSHAARRSLENYRPDSGAETLVRYLRSLSAGISKNRCEKRPLDSDQATWKLLTTPPKPPRKAIFWMRRFGKNAIIQGKLAASRPRRAKGHLIVAYHLVLKEDREKFEDQVRFFSDNFQLSSISEILQAATSGSQEDFRIALTFDDGFRLLMQDCLEILEKQGLKAAFFVPAVFVSSGLKNGDAAEFSTRAFYYNYPLEPMRPEDLKELVALGHEVGSHGLFHASIHSMMPESARRELTASRAMISGWTGVEPNGFSYPYGESSSSQGSPTDWLRTAGFTYALTLSRGCVDKDTDVFAVPRHHLEGNWSIPELRYFLLA